MRATGRDTNDDLPRHRSGVTKLLIGFVAILCSGYIAAASYMYVFQRDFVFKPKGVLASPISKGLPNVTQEVVTLEDGTSITVWSAAPTLEDAPTVLYFHGQSGNVSGRASRFQQIVGSGFGLYAPSYRGFAGSEGAPSEAAFVEDGLAYFDQLEAGGASVMVHGESLGTGVAAAVVEQRPSARMLILEAPYTAAEDMAAQRYPWLPVSLLMKDPFLTRDRIAAVESPTLIVHGTADKVIPVENGRKLFQLATEPKRLEIVEGVDHGSLWKNGLWPMVMRFLSETADQGSSSAAPKT